MPLDADLTLVASSLLGEAEPYDELYDSWSEGGIDIWDEKKWLRNQAAKPTGYVGAYPGRTGQIDPSIKPTTGGRSFLDVAKSQVGAPYVWADLNPVGKAGGPGAGFDCSGFTKYVLAKFGIDVPHQARQQMAQLPNIGRENLQPGDLVFFDYGRLGPGVADDVKLYIGDGKVIGASSGAGKVAILPLDEGHFLAGGSTGLTASGAVETTRNRRGRQGASPTPQYPSLAMVGASIAGSPTSYGSLGFAVGRTVQPQDVRDQHPTMKGPQGTVKEQLYEGFMAAGRPDLARMVNTKDFQTWVAAESGWNPQSVSRYYDGKVNGGLFQFRWFDERQWLRPFFSDGNDPNSSFTASPYEQAILVSKYFDLTPEDIRQYASQIRNGQYGGWG